MSAPAFRRLPSHLGVIPDGNRRWAQGRGLGKEQGYAHGVDPGLRLVELCRDLGVSELTFYGFTRDNTRRPVVQRDAFRQACVEAARRMAGRGAVIRAVGDAGSPLFPPELLPHLCPAEVPGALRVNLLVNYSWQWDLGQAARAEAAGAGVAAALGSAAVPRLDLVVRWGGRCRLSGFLPVQSVYADLFVVPDLWPDFQPGHLYDALAWYQDQDPTLGG